MPAVSSKSSSDSNTWKCMYCGAENDDSQLYCDGCGDKRPGVSSDKKTPIVSSKSVKQARDEAQDFEKPVEPETFEDEESVEADEGADSDDSDLDETAADEDDDKDTFHVPEPVISVDSGPATPTAPAPFTPSTFPASAVSTPTGQEYYFVFVNTPAQSLIKSKVAIEFDDFPIVTIGRSPENIVVIPDQEVSRKHAQLTLDGGRVMLKDLKSTNGTFVYDGKEFQRVSDSVEVRPNTILKFGTNTVVRLVSG